MTPCNRLYLLLLLSAALVLSSCDSSLDIDAGERKLIPLDPPGTTERIRPDTFRFELYLKDGWSGGKTRLQPIGGSGELMLDTTGAVPRLWLNISYTFNDVVFSKDNSTMLLLQQIQLRADSVASDGRYDMEGSPNNGNGTSVQLARYDHGFPLDTLDIVPPSQPDKVDSYATLSLAPTDAGTPGTKKITGVYTFTATVHDVASQQVISVPLEGRLESVYR